jgi:hypothetical protein
VEELVAQLRVETLTVAVLPRRTGLDVESFCSCIRQPYPYRRRHTSGRTYEGPDRERSADRG